MACSHRQMLLRATNTDAQRRVVYGARYAFGMQDLTAYRLRTCSPEDTAPLSLVAGAAFLEAFAGVLNAPDILHHIQTNNSPAAFAKYLSQPTTRAVLAEAEPGNAPVGYMLTCEPDLPVDLTPTDYELRRIYLLHRFQGCGLGRTLMHAALTAARELRRTRLLLGVYGKNHAAIRFYESMGFQAVGERYFTVGATTHHDAVMARVVEPELSR